MNVRRFSTLVATCLALVASGCSSEVGNGELDETSGSEDELVASFEQNGRIDLSKTVHLLLVGDSDKLGELPLYAATTRARRYAMLYPNDQVVLFVTQDVKASSVSRTGAAIVREEAFPNVALADLRRLSTTKLVSAMDRFTSIASIDFFGHSSPFGALLEAGGDDRVLSADSARVGRLADNFARDRDPYVTLNGCNGGVETAAELSTKLRVPVSGALTASNFQVLMSDGRWYTNDEGFYPPELAPVSKNELSFGPDSKPSCSRGACVRLKPQDSPYWGVWSLDTGFQYGLSYYKFFCAYPGAETDGTCARGMARSLYSFASVVPIDARSSDDDLELVLADFFCSSAKDRSWFDSCREGLFASIESDAPFSPMKSANDYSLECDFEKCEQEFRCTVVDGVPQKKTCAWVNAGCKASDSAPRCRTKNPVKQTTAREFKRYVEGHRLLRGN